MRENPRMAKASISNLIRTQLAGIRKEISEREKALTALRTEEKRIQEAGRLLSGGQVAPRERRKVTRPRKESVKRTRAKTIRKGTRIDWNATLKSLPSNFTMDDLAKKRNVEGKSRAYLHQIINRWKKAGSIKSVGRAKYQKV